MQAPVRTNDLLNAIRYLSKCQQDAPTAATATGQGRSAIAVMIRTAESIPHSQSWALIGEEYYTAKQILVANEQVLLRHIHFNIIAEHPHRYLFNYAATLSCPASVLRLAACLINDSLRLTCLSTEFSASDLAGGAVHAASLILGLARELPFEGSRSWWDALGLDLDHLEVIGAKLLALFQAS